MHALSVIYQSVDCEIPIGRADPMGTGHDVDIRGADSDLHLR
jgi:hypothetical protein